ncbi:PLDc N-terminal domain-containing protein, partial [Actinotalea sp. JY-7885]
MVRALPYIVPLALALFALIDLSRSSAVERAEIHPAAWVAIIVLLPVVGPVAWIAVSRSRIAAARRAAGGTAPTRPAPGRPKPR